MDTKLKALFESSVLNSETKIAIQEAFDAAVASKEALIAESYEVKLVEAKEEMMAASIAMIEEAVTEELQSIAEEVKHARTLDVQYAEKLDTFKESYAQKMDEQLLLMVAESVSEEFEGLREDIELAKKHGFVLKMFESFKDTYEQMFGNADITVFDRLAEAESKLNAFEREAKLNSLLEGITGRKRKVAMTILENVSLENLENRFAGIKDILLETVVEDPQVVVENVKEKVEVAPSQIVLESDDEKEKVPAISKGVQARLERSLKIGTEK